MYSYTWNNPMSTGGPGGLVPSGFTVAGDNGFGGSAGGGSGAECNLWLYSPCGPGDDEIGWSPTNNTVIPPYGNQGGFPNGFPNANLGGNGCPRGPYGNCLVDTPTTVLQTLGRDTISLLGNVLGAVGLILTNPGQTQQDEGICLKTHGLPRSTASGDPDFAYRRREIRQFYKGHLTCRLRLTSATRSGRRRFRGAPKNSVSHRTKRIGQDFISGPTNSIYDCARGLVPQNGVAGRLGRSRGLQMN